MAIFGFGKDNGAPPKNLEAPQNCDPEGFYVMKVLNELSEALEPTSAPEQLDAKALSKIHDKLYYVEDRGGVHRENHLTTYYRPYMDELSAIRQSLSGFVTRLRDETPDSAAIRSFHDAVQNLAATFYNEAQATRRVLKEAA